MFCDIKNVVHNLDAGLLCAPLLNIANYFKTVRYGCGSVAVIFSIFFNSVLFIYRGFSDRYIAIVQTHVHEVHPFMPEFIR